MPAKKRVAAPEWSPEEERPQPKRHFSARHAMAVSFRFMPTDEELVVYHLGIKLRGEEGGLPAGIIHEANVYDSTPAALTTHYAPAREGEWYFFSPRERLCPNGSRPNRRVNGDGGSGFWKATGSCVKIFYDGSVVGEKRSLAFFEGDSVRDAKKTNWIMHEFVDAQEGGDFHGWACCNIHMNGRQPKKQHSATPVPVPSPSATPQASSSEATQASPSTTPVASPSDPHQLPYWVENWEDATDDIDYAELLNQLDSYHEDSEPSGYFSF